MEANDLLLLGALVVAGYVFTRSDEDARPTGENSATWAQRADIISDEFDDQTRNEERFIGVPISPYQ